MLYQQLRRKENEKERTCRLQQKKKSASELLNEGKGSRKGTKVYFWHFGLLVVWQNMRTRCKQLAYLPCPSCRTPRDWRYFGQSEDWSDWTGRAINAINELYND